jgi:hypothetical protein
MNNSSDGTLSRAFWIVSLEHATSTWTLNRFPARFTWEANPWAAWLNEPPRNWLRASPPAEAVGGGAVAGGGVAGRGVAGIAVGRGVGAGASVAGNVAGAADAAGAGVGSVPDEGMGVGCFVAPTGAFAEERTNSR